MGVRIPMTFSFDRFATALRNGDGLSAEDVLAARRWAWEDGAVSQAEAETLFELDRLIDDSDRKWCDFFVEAMNEYVVNQLPPRGYVSDENAAWLMAQIDRDGQVSTVTELELIVKILETALNAPAALKSYVLGEIERIVLTGAGATRRGGDLCPGTIDEAEVALLRRLIFAPGSDDALIVTRAEAEMLWRLKDATLGRDNAPGWPDLFVRGVGNHLMAHGGDDMIDRAEAQRRETFMDDTSVNVARFMWRAMTSRPDLKGAGEALFGEESGAAEHDAAVARARAIDAGEADWVETRIRADQATDPLEAALIAFIREESGWQPAAA